MNFRLIHGECLQEMDKLISEGVKVDAIITDPPFGTTSCRWDSVIPFEPMWERLNKLIKPNGAMVLFGSEPFTSCLIYSNIKSFKHKWIWNKKQSGSAINAKWMPIKIDEGIIVFCSERVNYYPIMRKGKMRKRGGNNVGNSIMGKLQKGYFNYSDEYYPTNILNDFSNAKRTDKLHPTQKPVALMEYLIKTYTNECETVLDFTMGSGTTGVACRNLNRNFIGIELEEKYFKIATERINEEHSD